MASPPPPSPPASATPPGKNPSTTPPPPPINKQTGDSNPSTTTNLARKKAALETKNAALRAELETNQMREEEIRKGGLKNPSPELTVQKHITLLHQYNQIRDIGTGLLGIIAETRGVRVRDLYDEFGLGERD